MRWNCQQFACYPIGIRKFPKTLLKFNSFATVDDNIEKRVYTIRKCKIRENGKICRSFFNNLPVRMVPVLSQGRTGFQYFQ